MDNFHRKIVTTHTKETVVDNSIIKVVGIGILLLLRFSFISILNRNIECIKIQIYMIFILNFLFILLDEILN